MTGAGIDEGDLLIIDRSLNPENNKIAVCYIDGEFTLKRIILKNKKLFLKPENSKYKQIVINEEDNLIVWGIVSYVIKSVL